MDAQTLQIARNKAQEIVARLRSDAAFRQQAEDDPHGVLLAAGLPEAAIPEFLRATGPEPEVSGYQDTIVAGYLTLDTGGSALRCRPTTL